MHGFFAIRRPVPEDEPSDGLYDAPFSSPPGPLGQAAPLHLESRENRVPADETHNLKFKPHIGPANQFQPRGHNAHFAPEPEPVEEGGGSSLTTILLLLLVLAGICFWKRDDLRDVHLPFLLQKAYGVDQLRELVQTSAPIMQRVGLLKCGNLFHEKVLSQDEHADEESQIDTDLQIEDAPSELEEESGESRPQSPSDDIVSFNAMPKAPLPKAPSPPPTKNPGGAPAPFPKPRPKKSAAPAARVESVFESDSPSRSKVSAQTMDDNPPPKPQSKQDRSEAASRRAWAVRVEMCGAMYTLRVNHSAAKNAAQLKQAIARACTATLGYEVMPAPWLEGDVDTMSIEYFDMEVYSVRLAAQVTFLLLTHLSSLIAPSAIRNHELPYISCRTIQLR